MREGAGSQALLVNDLQVAPATEIWARVKLAKCKAHKAREQVSLVSANSGHAMDTAWCQQTLALLYLNYKVNGR